MTTFFDLTGLGLGLTQDELVKQWLAGMQLAFPEYAPSTANLEFIQTQIFASFAETLSQQTSAGGTELFRTFGTDLLQLPYEIGSPAAAVVNVTAIDNAGYTLDAGTQLTLTQDGSPLGFFTVSDLVIAPGSTSGQATVFAVQSGTLFNGAGDPATPVAQITWLAGITTVTSAAGGVDPEDDDHYIQRLKTTLTTLAPRPITASDYALIAPDFPPTAGTAQQEVGRATAIDGYDPGPGPAGAGWSAQAGGTNTYNNQRECTVCVADATGQPLSDQTLTAVQQWLQAKREVNFIVNVVSPNYSNVYVAATVVAAPGWDAATVKAGVQSALLAFLSPQAWGLPAPAVEAAWTNYQTIFRSRISAVVQAAAGVDHVRVLAFDLNSNPTNTTNDLSLPGPFPMPVTSTATVPLSAITVV